MVGYNYGKYHFFPDMGQVRSAEIPQGYSAEMPQGYSAKPSAADHQKNQADFLLAPGWLFIIISVVMLCLTACFVAVLSLSGCRIRQGDLAQRTPQP